MKPAYSINPVAIDIDLLSGREPAGRVPVVPVLLVLLALCAASAVGWLWYDARQELRTAQAELADTNAAIAALESGLTRQPAGGRIADWLAQPERLIASKPAATAVVRELARLLPAYANMTQLEMDEKSGLTVTLFFATTEDLIAFRQEAERSPAFKLESMGAISSLDNAAIMPGGEDGTVKLPVYQASFKLQYVPPGEREN